MVELTLMRRFIFSETPGVLSARYHFRNGLAWRLKFDVTNKSLSNRDYQLTVE